MKKILTNKLNILLVLLLTCIAILCGCKTNNTSNTPKNKNVEVGVWWWDNRIDSNTYLNFAKENSVTEIYYYTSSFNEKTSNFITLANSLNIKVFLLGGKKEFLTNPQLAHTLVQKYLTYQQNNPQAKFCGIQFDIEPHQFSDFEENREKYLYDLINFANTFKLAYPQITFDYAIPFWLDELITFNGTQKEAYKHLIDISNRVLVMSYRDTAEKIYDVGEDEVEYANQTQKQLNLCVETGSEENIVTFYEEGKKVLYEQLEILKNKIPQNFGISIHDIKRWYNLKN